MNQLCLMSFEIGSGAHQFHLNCHYSYEEPDPKKVISWDKIKLSSHDYDALQRYYEKLFYDPVIQNNLGVLLTKFHFNHTEARKWFELSALQNNKGAQYNLGRMYYFGAGYREKLSNSTQMVHGISPTRILFSTILFR